MGEGPGLPRLDNRAYTAGRERHDKGTLDFRPLPDRGAVLITGEYPISEPPYRVWIAQPAPERQAAETLRALLAQAGVEINGRIRLSHQPAAADVVLARLDSPPLADWLPPILGDSHNWYAEMLLRQLAFAVTGEGRYDAALELLDDFLESTAGVDRGAFFLDDGSGLSADDLVSPEAVVAVLAWAWDQPWRRVLVEALARPGRGSLEAWGPLPDVAAKSGTRRHAQALAGYLHPRSEEPVIFAVFLDHRIAPPAELRAEIAALLRRF
ncbi:MAG: D-alanyl-D-alanine carboxypeptidase/D-alanyl-D-alanine-endopeptidase [Acidobacteria bacterium]|nr:MAG: D-alanyl-D-alanine carboxypeptidase/D-alanyl-D-alanine-endopeptidase [Acidobacteriota bacterium]